MLLYDVCVVIALVAHMTETHACQELVFNLESLL